MTSRITIRDIASHAGVHYSTVALALKNDPRVHPKTQERIREISRTLGYIPDPMLSALSAYRHTKQPSQYRGTVAWVTNFPSPDGWERETFVSYREGAAEALAQVGYKLEDFWLRQDGMTSRRAGEILHSRGVRGLLMCPQPVSGSSVDLQWKRFAAITFGYTLSSPSLHMLTTFHYNSMYLAVTNLRSLGYKRIGLVMPKLLNERTQQFWLAAYQTLMLADKATEFPPILYLRESGMVISSAHRRLFLKWFRAHRPDSILGFWQEHRKWLEEEGWSIPRDVGFASLALEDYKTSCSGIVQPNHDIGRAAGNFLSGMLHRGEYGPPAVPQSILLNGTWNPGETLSQVS